MMKKLHLRLLFYALVMGMAILLGFGYFTFFTVKDAAIQNEEIALLIAVRDAAKLIEARNEIQFTYLEALASGEVGSFSDKSLDEQIAKLNKENKKRNRFDLIGIADINGNLVLPKADGITNHKIDITERTYFHEALKGNRSLMNPARSINPDFTNELVVVYAVPKYSGNKVTNVLIGTSRSNFISELSNDIRFGNTGYAYILDSTGTVIAHVNNDLVESQFNGINESTAQEKYKSVADMFTSTQSFESGNIQYRFENKNLYAAFSKIDNTDWTLFIALPEEEIISLVLPLLKLLIGITFVVIFIGAIVYFRMLAAVSKSHEEAELEKTKLSHLATYDALTGVYNRNAGLVLLSDRMSLSLRENKPLCLVFIDIDNLKTTNDLYGHQSGDHLIVSIVDIVLKKIRKTDSVCRIGGDEFVLGLYDCPLDQAHKLMKAIDEAMAAYNSVSRQNYALEISYGIVHYDWKKHEDITALIEAADHLMYQAKRRKKTPV